MLNTTDIRKLYVEDRLVHGTVSNLPVWTVRYARAADPEYCRPPTGLSCSFGGIMERVGRLASKSWAILPGQSQADLVRERPTYR